MNTLGKLEEYLALRQAMGLNCMKKAPATPVH
jgi:hypothetical protein